jgi:hypothetical protein
MACEVLCKLTFNQMADRSVERHSLQNPALEPATTRLLFVGVLAVALALTRWTIAPQFLFDFDNVNFALALKQFAPLLSQPHRGYPLYVGVSRIVHWFGFSPEWTSLSMGFLGSLVALVFLIPLARDMFGFRAAWIAPLLLFCHPTFVMAGAVDHVRTFLAAGAIATALFVWRGQFKTAAFVLGLAGGFRMELAPTLLPLFLLSPLLVHRVSWKRLIAPCAILALTTTPWVLFTVLRSGAFSAALQFNSAMLRDNARSFWYEGFTYRATIMALFATYWNGIGSLSWLWAIPAAISRDNAPDRWREFAFLAIWFVPPYLLSAVVQVTDPDQTLASMAATCLVGAWALSRLRSRWTALACFISIALFVFPPVHMGREASLPWIRRVSAVEKRALEGVAHTPGPRLISIRGEYPTWRLVSYYFPEDWIQQSNVTAHANRVLTNTPPRDLRSHVVINEQGDVFIE